MAARHRCPSSGIPNARGSKGAAVLIAPKPRKEPHALLFAAQFQFQKNVGGDVVLAVQVCEWDVQSSRNGPGSRQGGFMGAGLIARDPRAAAGLVQTDEHAQSILRQACPEPGLAQSAAKDLGRLLLAEGRHSTIFEESRLKFSTNYVDGRAVDAALRPRKDFAMQAASPMPTSGRVSVPARLLATARKPKRGVEGSMDVCIGAQVRIQRERLGMSLSALARESGLSLSMLSRVERGLVSSSTQTLGRIAAALQVRMGVFFEEALPPIANDEDASRPSSAGT